VQPAVAAAVTVDRRRPRSIRGFDTASDRVRHDPDQGVFVFRFRLSSTQRFK
jgi:hypothetical protein